MGKMKELWLKKGQEEEIQELKHKVSVLEEELRWRRELLKKRTDTLYQMIQRAQDVLSELPDLEEDDD